MRRRPRSPLVCTPLSRRAALPVVLGLALAPACAPKRTTTPPPPAHTPGPVAAAVPKDSSAAAQDGKDAAPKWDVADPPGAETEVAIDVREGTWMSLDVSPDGRDLAFDLLGDLHVVPLAGGEARALTSGMAWDMQPRFSPDGQWIAFTSDRGGGDNIWVIPRAGGDARQITREDFRLLNSPVWAPDGNFIAARKHFTKTRSLGSGEIWLYHVSGGKGVQMTEKPNDQKDVGEPAFSPDGKYVYFSQDVTPGPVFEYNKDPYGEIYAIKRLERATGRIEKLVGGSGGAARPTPSPDGKSLAFIRRVGGTGGQPDRTTLFVRDLESGAERPVYAGLDRDMQETWAIHGVYPTMTWTPDSREVVFWAAGKLWRIRVDGSQSAPAEIGFHVKSTRKVAPAVRFPVAVAPREFPVKALRGVTVSPDGKAVVYQALGHLYLRTLPEGQPRRLTRQTDHFEQFPAFSRDGKQLVFTTWDDAALGSVRVIAVKGGKERTISDRPGHYVEPQFSPDGQTVVFRRVAGGWTRTPTWSQEPGIYAAPLAKGGKPRLVTRDGEDPHFGAASDRVFYTVAGDDKVELASVELDGSDAHTHVKTDAGTRFRVSPDGRWIAWNEGFQALIAPFAPTGRTLELGPKSEALPIARVSRDAGEQLHWSGDSQRLHWSLGPELYTRELRDAFTFVAGAPAKLPEPAEKGTPIGFAATTATPPGKRAVVGARVITMKGDEVIEDATILIAGDRITALGPSTQIQVPADAAVVQAEGKTIIPGLVDVHAHGSQGEDGLTPEQNWLHYAELAYGVTTVHDPSNDTHSIFAASELQRAGAVVGPRIYSTGTILYGAQAPFKAEINGIDDARAHLRRLKAIGAFSVKSYNQPRREQRQQVLAAARELEMMVVPEGGSLYHHNMTMIADGHTGVEHAIPVASAYADVMQFWGGTQVGYTPTLGVAYGGLGGENYWYAQTQVYEDARLRRFVPAFAFEPRARRRTLAADNDWNHVRVAQTARKLLDAGVKVQLGAHGQREGLAAHWELWSLAQGGMTPMQALRAGTLHGAQYLGLDKDLGSIEPGKLADLVVLEQDPRSDIRLTRQVAMVMVGGWLFDANTMAEIGGLGRKPAPFWFSEAGRQASPGKPPKHAVCGGHLAH